MTGGCLSACSVLSRGEEEVLRIEKDRKGRRKEKGLFIRSWIPSSFEGIEREISIG